MQSTWAFDQVAQRKFSQYRTCLPSPLVILVSYKPVSGSNDLVGHMRKMRHHTHLFLEALIPLSAQGSRQCRLHQRHHLLHIRIVTAVVAEDTVERPAKMLCKYICDFSENQQLPFCKTFTVRIQSKKILAVSITKGHN